METRCHFIERTEHLGELVFSGGPGVGLSWIPKDTCLSSLSIGYLFILLSKRADYFHFNEAKFINFFVYGSCLLCLKKFLLKP
jgi:hypothetical protein